MFNKRRLSVLVLAFGMIAGASLIARADDGPGGPGGNPPPKQGADDQAPGGGPGGPAGGNARRGGPQPGFHLIPKFVEDKLDLTDDQKTQMAALEKETKAKLEKILTPDQVKILATARPPGRQGQGGRGQAGGRGQGGPGAPDSDNQKKPGDGSQQPPPPAN